MPCSQPLFPRAGSALRLLEEEVPSSAPASARGKQIFPWKLRAGHRYYQPEVVILAWRQEDPQARTWIEGKWACSRLKQ